MTRKRASRDVIAALGTAEGAAERAVIRVSGPSLLEERARILPVHPIPPPRRGAFACQVEWSAGARVPAHLLQFPGPGSATGEDVVEIHLPGSRPVVDGALRGLFERGARPAEPGEFTRRAFLHGRLDLAQAEAVLDLVTTRSAAAARAAAALLRGALGASLTRVRDALAAALAELEAGLDFEEGDAQDVRPEEIEPLLREAREALEEGLRGEEQRRVRGGPWRIGLWGPPNAGKTSLFRRLTGREAMVSQAAGTTRDRMEGEWQAPGQQSAWLLADGPGRGGAAVDVRDAAARARAALDEADLWWLVLDSSSSESAPPSPVPEGARSVVWSKSDLPPAVSDETLHAAAAFGPTVWVSSVDGSGLDDLASATAEALHGAEEARAARRGSGERHRAALRDARESLARAEELRATGGPAELVAEELRAALQPLGELVGELTPEDLLDRIFARFCLGK